MKSLYVFLPQKLCEVLIKILPRSIAASIQKKYLILIVFLLSYVLLVVPFDLRAQEPIIGGQIQNYTALGPNPQFGQVYYPTQQTVLVETKYNGDQEVSATFALKTQQPSQNGVWLLIGGPDPAYPQGILISGKPKINVVSPQVFVNEDALYLPPGTPPLPANYFDASDRIDISSPPPFNNDFSPVDAQSTLWAAETFARYCKLYFGYAMPLTLNIELTEEEVGYYSLHQVYSDDRIVLNVRARIEQEMFAQGPNYILPDVSVDNVSRSAASVLYRKEVFPRSADDVLEHEEYGIIKRGFVDIMGVVVRRTVDDVPVWTMGDLQQKVGLDLINCEDPKLTLRTDTYKDAKYIDPSDPNYDSFVDEAINAGLIHKWYYLLSHGGQGTNGLGHDYDLKPLIEGDDKWHESEVTAAALLFKSIILDPSFTITTSILELRDITLKYAMGNICDYAKIANAWYAVGVGDKFELPQPGDIDFRPEEPTPEDYYALHQKFLISDNQLLNGSSVKQLFVAAHDDMPQVSTRKDGVVPFVDSDDKDEIFDDISYNATVDMYGCGVNDLTTSMNGVTVHETTLLALQYFAETFNWHGLDNKGKDGLQINSYVDPAYPPPYGFRANEGNFYYKGGTSPQDQPDLSLDVIASHVTKAIEYYKMGGLLPNPTNPEAMAINESIGQILGVQAMNWATGSNTWIFGEHPGDKQHNLDDPKANKEPCMYQGEFYQDKINNPAALAGVMNKWFMLLANGGAGYRDKKLQYGSYYLPGIGVKSANMILFELIEKLNGDDTFETAREKTLETAESVSSIFTRNELISNLKEAWWAVGNGDRGKEDFTPKDGAPNVPMFPSEVRFAGKFNSGVNYQVLIWEGASPDTLNWVNTKKFMLQGVKENEDTGKMEGFFNLTLDGLQSISWMVRPTAFVNEDGQTILASQKFGDDKMELLWSGKRTFTTESLECVDLSPKNGDDSVYPWEGKFNWKLKQYDYSLVPEVGSYHITVAEDQNVTIFDKYLDNADVEPQPKPGQDQEWTAPLKVLHPYWWKVQATSGDNMHSIHEKRRATGKASSIYSFHTMKPNGYCSSPGNGTKVSPFGGADLSLEALPTDGAKGYRFEMSTDSSFPPAHTYTFKGTWGDVPDDQVISNQIVGDKLGDPKLGPVTDGKAYYWRLVPLGPKLELDVNPNPPYYEEGGLSGDQRYFTVDYSLAKPVLQSPSNNDYIEQQVYNQGFLTFQWSPVPNAKQYRLSIFRTGQVTTFLTPTETSGTTVDVPNSWFYDDVTNQDRSYYWTVTAIPDQQPGGSLPEVTSAARTFYMDADIPVASSPGTPCVWVDGCDSMYDDESSATVDKGMLPTGDLVYTWDSKYHPWGFWVRTREYNTTGQPIPWIMNGLASDNSMTQSFNKNTFEDGKTYYWSVRSIPHALSNISPTTDLVDPIPSSTPMMFKISAPCPDPVDVPIDIDMFDSMVSLEFVLTSDNCADGRPLGYKCDGNGNNCSTEYSWGTEYYDYTYPLPPGTYTLHLKTTGGYDTNAQYAYQSIIDIYVNDGDENEITLPADTFKLPPGTEVGSITFTIN